LDPPGSPAELYSRHTPPKRISEVARAAHVHRLILSHIPPLVDKARRVKFCTEPDGQKPTESGYHGDAPVVEAGF
jgi:ribonuclease BN (tRNA processing enzyme)